MKYTENHKENKPMNRFEIINKIGDKYHVGNTESGEFSYVQALKSVGKDIKDYQKAKIGLADGIKLKFKINYKTMCVLKRLFQIRK